MVSLHMRPVNERELIWIVMSLCFMACFTVKLFCKVSSRIFFCLGGVADGREGRERRGREREGGREGETGLLTGSWPVWGRGKWGGLPWEGGWSFPGAPSLMKL